MSEQVNGADPNGATPVPAIVQAWIQNESIPVTINEPSVFNAEIDAFVTALGEGVEVLGLGEALHGGEEILQFRNQLFQRLVEHHGYTAIAIESSFPRARLLNDFILGDSALTTETLWENGFSHDFGRLIANRELIAWMQQYNATHSNKIRFYGFDSPTEIGPTDSPRTLLYVALDYLADSDSAAATTHRTRIDTLLRDDALWENPNVIMNPSVGIGLSPNATALRIATENLITTLQALRPELVAGRGMERFREAMHAAALARQLLTYHAGLATASSDRYAHLSGLRTVMMADNLEYIVTRERPYGKVMLFAHNAHLQRSKVEWQMGSERMGWWTAGAHLDVLFGSRYALIGSAVGVSPDNGIAEPEANTLEELFSTTAHPIQLLPTHRGQLPLTEAVAVLPTRSGSMQNRSYFALTSQSMSDFDWIAMFDSVTYNRKSESR